MHDTDETTIISRLPESRAEVALKPEFFYFIINRKVFFNIGICCWQVSLWLVVIVIRYKILYRVFREELFKLTI